MNQTHMPTAHSWEHLGLRIVNVAALCAALVAVSVQPLTQRCGTLFAAVFLALPAHVITSVTGASEVLSLVLAWLLDVVITLVAYLLLLMMARGAAWRIQVLWTGVTIAWTAVFLYLLLWSAPLAEC